MTISHSTDPQTVILLVEDHDDTRTTLAMMLRMKGFAVNEAIDGVHALELLLEKTPHLILTDLRMPNMDGLELSRQVKSVNAYRHIPIVMISATPPGDRSLYPEVSDFIQKPSSFDDILLVLKKHM